MENDIDILVITYNRPLYTRLTLERLLATCDETMRVWIWHNENDEETLAVVQSYLNHPCLYKFHHSKENKILIEPINWLWANAKGEYLCVLGDDSLVSDGWAQKLRRAHQDVNEFGVLGCWHFLPEDFIPEVAKRKIKTFRHGHRLLQNPWVGSSAHLMKRKCVQLQGLLREKETFPQYCVRLRWRGWINGWYYPFVQVEHMDDPRSTHTQLKSDENLLEYLPLTARKNSISTLEDWEKLIKKTAQHAQTSKIEPCRFFFLRSLPYRVLYKISEVTLSGRKEKL